MIVNFYINKKISLKYFTYIILKSSNPDGIFSVDLIKNKYGFNKIITKQISDSINKFSLEIKECLKEINQKNIVELLVESISGYPSEKWSDLENKISSLFFSIFEIEKEKLLSQKKFLENKNYLNILGTLEKVFNTKIENVDVYLIPGGFESFVPGLSLNLNIVRKHNLKPTILLSSSNILERYYCFLESTIIHEIAHVLENNSDVNKIAKKHVLNSDILNYKPKNINSRHFFFESLVTAIAGNKFSYHIKKYHPEYYKKYESPNNPNIQDIYRKLASVIVPIITQYIDSEKKLDDNFFEQIGKMI